MSWKRTCSAPISLIIRSCSLRNPSGSHVSPVRGDGNKYGFSGCLSCSSTRSFTVSSGSRTVRMEFGVFGVLMTSFPSCRATLLLMDNVRFRTSKSSHRKASNSPRRKPVVSSRYIGARMPCSFAALRYGPINASGRMFISFLVFFGILHLLAGFAKISFSSTAYSNALFSTTWTHCTMRGLRPCSFSSGWFFFCTRPLLSNSL